MSVTTSRFEEGDLIYFKPKRFGQSVQEARFVKLTEEGKLLVEQFECIIREISSYQVVN